MGQERKRLVGLAIIIPGLVLAGCQGESFQPVSTSTSIPTPKPTIETRPGLNEETLNLLNDTQAEVARLLDKSGNPLVKEIFLSDNLTEFNPIFVKPVGVGIADPNVTYARTRFGIAKYSPQKRFVYYMARDGSEAEYATLETMDLSVYFSPVWLDSESDRVKDLAIEKEAYTIAQWSGFSMLALSSYLTQGEVSLIDSSVEEIEIANTFARNLLIENPSVLKLYDYAAYLMVLEKVGEIVSTASEQELEELRYSNLFDIYTRALDAGVDFKGIVFGSERYYNTAFNPQGAWGNMILRPEVPGPEPLMPGLDELPVRHTDTVAMTLEEFRQFFA